MEKYWKTKSPSYSDGPEVESFKQFIKRARKILKRLKHTKSHTTAVFSHVQFICALLWLSQRDPGKLSQETMQDFRSFLYANSLPNGAIVRVQFRNSCEHWQYEIIPSHLEELKKLEEPKKPEPTPIGL